MHHFFMLRAQLLCSHTTYFDNKSGSLYKQSSFLSTFIHLCKPSHQQFKRKNVWKGNEGRFFCERIELFGVCRIEDDCDVSDEYLSTSHQNHTTLSGLSVSLRMLHVCKRKKLKRVETPLWFVLFRSYLQIALSLSQRKKA